MSAPLLQLAGIVKHYGPVHALDDVSFTLHPGEIVGLVGDNGAGKSTLVKVMSGAVQPDAGTIRFEAREVRIASPLEARALGIETVYQDLAVVPHMDVEANLFLGREITGTRWWKSLAAATRRRCGGGDGAHRLVAGGADLGPPAGGIAVGRPAPERRGRPRHLLGAQDGHHGRAHGRARRARIWRGVLELIKGPGEGTRHGRGAGQPQHPAGVRDRRPIFVLRHGRRVGELHTREAAMNDVVGLITGVRVADSVNPAPSPVGPPDPG